MTLYQITIQFLYMSLQCLPCRHVVMMFRKFSPLFSWIIFPLVMNWWYICGIFITPYIFVSGVILNWWNFKINILFNIIQSRTFMRISGFKINLFQWIFVKLDIRLISSKSIELPVKYFEDWDWVLFYWKKNAGQSY